MRLSHVVVVVAATYFVASEAFSTATDSNQVKISQEPLGGASIERLLRTHDTTVDDEDDLEERGLTSEQMEKMRKFAVKKGINWERAQIDTFYLQTHAKFGDYVAKLNKYIQRNKEAKAKAARKAARTS